MLTATTEYEAQECTLDITWVSYQLLVSRILWS